jgi:hypothetical protein
MQLHLHRALSWKLHPPTPYCFCQHILFLLPQASVPMETRYEILELARFLTELSVIDYYFVVQRSSDVALAALLNSMQVVTGTKMIVTGFEEEIRRVARGLDPYKKEVLDCRNRLKVLYTQGGYTRPEINGHETRDKTVSPVCVSHGLAQQEYPCAAAPAGCPMIQNNAITRDESHKYFETKFMHVDDIHDLTKNASPVSKQSHCGDGHEAQLNNMV